MNIIKYHIQYGIKNAGRNGILVSITLPTKFRSPCNSFDTKYNID